MNQQFWYTGQKPKGGQLWLNLHQNYKKMVNRAFAFPYSNANWDHFNLEMQVKRATSKVLKASISEIFMRHIAQTVSYLFYQHKHKAICLYRFIKGHKWEIIIIICHFHDISVHPFQQSQQPCQHFWSCCSRTQSNSQKYI